MKAGIVLDSWKLPIFERHLATAGFAFEKGQGIIPNTVTLFVTTNKIGDLQKTIREANTEAALNKN